jgi:mannose-6-phosphate isomerase-like protein (cupin superfamily)
MTYMTERPWGGYRILSGTAGAPAAVKILTVLPGARLSLQTHQLRSEEWTAVSPGLKAQIGDEIIELTPFYTFRIPVGAVHRIINDTLEVGHVVELLYGVYDEDDIERLEDDYGRIKN